MLHHKFLVLEYPTILSRVKFYNLKKGPVLGRGANLRRINFNDVMFPAP